MQKWHKQQSSIPESVRSIRAFAFTSGKGGVGKTNIVANVATALTLAGKRVAVLDGDLGLSNLELFFGGRSEYSLADFFAGTCSLEEIVTPRRQGLLLFPGASGLQTVTTLSDIQKQALVTALDTLPLDIEFLLIDTGPGVSDVVTYFATAAHEIVVVVTPEPPAVADAAALIKVLATVYHEKRFWLLANTVANANEARRLYDTLAGATLPLSVSLHLLGWIPHDPALGQAVAECQLVVEATPTCPASRAFETVAQTLMATAAHSLHVKGGLQFFFQQLLCMSQQSTYRTHGAPGQTHP